MSQVLTNFEIASLVGSAVLRKGEDDLQIDVRSDLLTQVEGYTPEKTRSLIYVVTDEEMVEVRVSFLGQQGLSFGFKIFSDEATHERVTRYTSHYMKKHAYHQNMMNYEI